MSGATAGARLGKSREEGEALLDGFFNGFKSVKLAIDYSKDFLRKNEYVEDFYGRRRHLKEINLPPYEVKYLKKDEENKEIFNPFLECQNRNIDTPVILKWKQRIKTEIANHQAFIKRITEQKGNVYTYKEEMSNKTFKALEKEALADGVLLIANTGRKAQAERQCFNARIQGGAATLTKLAMIDINNDKILNDCQAKLIIPVHDELLVECPAYYADLVEERLPQVMVDAAARAGIDIPQSCDPYNVTRWYADEMYASVIDSFKKHLADGKTHDEAIDLVCEEHEEIPRQSLIDAIEGKSGEEIVF